MEPVEKSNGNRRLLECQLYKPATRIGLPLPPEGPEEYQGQLIMPQIMASYQMQASQSNGSSMCIQTIKPNPNSLNGRQSRNSKVQIKYPIFKKKAAEPSFNEKLPDERKRVWTNN